MINFKIITTFPELFPGPLSTSITGSALKSNLWSYKTTNIRDFAKDDRKTIDDTPYGGGSGMVLKADILGDAIESTKTQGKIIYLSPRGKKFDQQLAKKLSNESEITLICGRYEGIDQRVIDEHEIEEISIGDYVLSNGEIASYVFIDAILRNIDGVLGDIDSLNEESFSFDENDEFENLLEYPHYTRPAIWKGREVPQILTSGNHQKIKDWRKQKSIEITKKNRPDFLKNKSYTI